jgi:cell shape-determining protein MreD
VVGVVAIVVGLAADDTTTAIFGVVALVLGLTFAIPLLRGRGRGRGPGPD